MKLASLLGHIVELLGQIDRTSQPADKLTATFFKERRYLGSRDRRFISAVLYGMIRHRRFIEALLERYIEEHPTHETVTSPHIRYIPLYTIFAAAWVSDHSLVESGDEIPLPSPAIWKTYFPSVDLQEFIEWVRSHRSLDYLHIEDAVRLGVRFSFQDWMVEQWLSEFGAETESLLRALNSPAVIAIRVNTLKTSIDNCRNRLLLEGIETEPSTKTLMGLASLKRFNAQASQAFRDGWYEVQDVGSQIVSEVADPQPGSLVIDACAGTGGKTLHLAALMRNDGEIVAVDIERRRLSELKSRVERAGVQIATIVQRETFPADNYRDRADLVLVDAPCSGIGTIRRNPWLKWSVSEPVVQHHAERQKELLAFNAQFVKTGGRLIYATCSLMRQENEGVVDSFLAAHPHFQAVSIGDRFQSLDPEATQGRIHLFPHRHATDGFFIAVMKKA